MRKTGNGSLRNGRRQNSSGSGSAGTSIIPFFLTALYDGKVFAKAKMAVFCTFMIEDLYLASWRKDEGREIWNREEPQKRLAEQVKICQTAARQIENSAENRDPLGAAFRSILHQDGGSVP